MAEDDFADRLRKSVRMGLLFGCPNEPLDDYGKRIVRTIIMEIELAAASQVMDEPQREREDPHAGITTGDGDARKEIA